MRALISADMEGATGVTCPDDVRPGSPQWERFRRLFTGDVNAAARGLFDAGVEEVVVNEAHSSMRNLLLEDLDPRLKMITGSHKPLGMMEGIQQRPDLAAFVGYHAGPGEPGVLSHTFTGYEIFAITVNGQPASEGYLNALLAAEYGTRIALVSGDDLTCEDAKRYAPGAQLAVVKEAVDRYTALCHHPSVTAERLRRSAAQGTLTAEVPALPPGPYTTEVTFTGVSCATMAACIPTVERTGPRTVEFTSDTVTALYQCLRITSRIAAGAAQPEYG